MTDDRRALLEAIAFGDDQRVTPSDRLRALEHLSRIEETDPPNAGYSSELASLEGEELDRHLDALLAEKIAGDVFGEAKRWPVLAKLVSREVDRRARTLAKDLDVAQVEAEIERRVEERMRQLATTDPMEEASDPPAVAYNTTGQSVPVRWPSGRPRLPTESGLRRRPRAA
jgi:hypothetical protein